jgi:hypothetical protein
MEQQAVGAATQHDAAADCSLRETLGEQLTRLRHAYETDVPASLRLEVAEVHGMLRQLEALVALPTTSTGAAQAAAAVSASSCSFPHSASMLEEFFDTVKSPFESYTARLGALRTFVTQPSSYCHVVRRAEPLAPRIVGEGSHPEGDEEALVHEGTPSQTKSIDKNNTSSGLDSCGDTAPGMGDIISVDARSEAPSSSGGERLSGLEMLQRLLQHIRLVKDELCPAVFSASGTKAVTDCLRFDTVFQMSDDKKTVHLQELMEVTMVNAARAEALEDRSRRLRGRWNDAMKLVNERLCLFDAELTERELALGISDD